MLTIVGDGGSGGPGGSAQFCDGLTRRGFLKIGGLAMGGLAMPQLLAAESMSGVGSSHKAIIMVYLAGGPPHQDMFDMKPDAPSEARSLFNPIKTNVGGIEICHLMPRMARMMDKFVVIRSIVGAQPRAEHNPESCLTGHEMDDIVPGGWPYIGSVISKFQGPVDAAVPPALALDYPNPYHGLYNRGREPGFLGRAHAPFEVNIGGSRQDMVLKGVSVDRLEDRRALLASFDQFRRNADQSGIMEGIDINHRKAMDILTSSRLAEALDLSKEDPKLRDRYGRLPPNRDGVQMRSPEQFLMARRLVEAGARCVTFQFGMWDWHGDQIFQGGDGPVTIPLLDLSLSALVEDLHNRGMDKDVTVVVWGEFGRTPYINGNGGRDHWAPVSFALLAGGGMKTGQVIGSTDRLAAEVKSRPVHFQDVFATMYHNIGIDLDKAVFHDLTGRPHPLVGHQFSPIAEVI